MTTGMNLKTLNLRVPGLIEDLSEKEKYTISIYSALVVYINSIIPIPLSHNLCFMNSKRAAGICISAPANVIAIAREYMNSDQVTEYDIYNTLLHELAHAIVGCDQGHNEFWKKTFIILGGDGNKHSSKGIDDVFYKYTIFCKEGCKANRDRLHQKTWRDKYCTKHRLPLHIIKRK